MSLKALLVGIDEYDDSPLRGCENDVASVRALLSRSYGASGGAVRVLLNEEGTFDAIVGGLGWLAEGAGDGDVRLFHFSGHGSIQPDESGDEEDGRDEGLVPHDHRSRGLLIDDALRELYARFDPRSHLLLVMDCCHSGTIQRDLAADVVYRFLGPGGDASERAAAAAAKNRAALQSDVLGVVKSALRGTDRRAMSDGALAELVQRVTSRTRKKRFHVEEQSGHVVLLAACRDDQTAADKKFGATYHGALTYYLLEALSGGAPATYATLIEGLASRMTADGLSQTPVLACGRANRARSFLGARLEAHGGDGHDAAKDGDGPGAARRPGRS